MLQIGLGLIDHSSWIMVDSTWKDIAEITNKLGLSV